MSNKARGQRTIEDSEGKSYAIYFTANALAELEDQLGGSVLELGEKFTTGKAGFKELRALFWSGLLEKQPETTVREAGNIMTDVGLEEAIKVATEAFVESFPKAQGSGGGKGNAVSQSGAGKK